MLCIVSSWFIQKYKKLYPESLSPDKLYEIKKVLKISIDVGFNELLRSLTILIIRATTY